MNFSKLHKMLKEGLRSENFIHLTHRDDLKLSNIDDVPTSNYLIDTGQATRENEYREFLPNPALWLTPSLEWQKLVYSPESYPPAHEIYLYKIKIDTSKLIYIKSINDIPDKFKKENNTQFKKYIPLSTEHIMYNIEFLVNWTEYIKFLKTKNIGGIYFTKESLNDFPADVESLAVFNKSLVKSISKPMEISETAEKKRKFYDKLMFYLEPDERINPEKLPKLERDSLITHWKKEDWLQVPYSKDAKQEDYIWKWNTGWIEKE